MKIPSQFNEDSLYNRQSGPRVRRAESIQASRRLVRLGLGLLLVIVVIRQVSKPEFYQPFFSGNQATPTRVVQPPGSQVGAFREKPALEADPILQAEAGWIAAQIPRPEQPIWLAELLRTVQSRELGQTNDDVNAFANWPESSWSDELFSDASAPIRSHEQQAWLDFLQQFPLSVGAKQAEAEFTGRDLRLVALMNALDQISLQRVVDGGVWSGQDADALYRFLAEAQHMYPVSGQDSRPTLTGIPPRIGILPLLQQPKVYAGTEVSFRGRVARCERQMTSMQSVAANAYGITHYYRLWLRPLSGTDRPLLAIVPEVSEEIAAVGADGIRSEGPPVLVAGHFLKRLAYRSAAGPDLAPVIVGGLVGKPSTSEAMSAELTNANEGTQAGQPPPVKSSSIIVLVASAFFVGSGLAAILFYHTNAQAKRSRQLREISLKDPTSFLSDLANRDQ